MKKILTIVILMIILITLSGCLSIDLQSDTKIGREQAEEILRCFDEEDIEGLKSMFCKKISDTYNLDRQIKEAMDFFDGKTISHDDVLVGGGDSVRDGKVVDKHISYMILNIQSSTEKKYKIDTHSYLVYDDEDYIGMTHIKIFDCETDESIQIGEYIY